MAGAVHEIGINLRAIAYFFFSLPSRPFVVIREFQVDFSRTRMTKKKAVEGTYILRILYARKKCQYEL